LAAVGLGESRNSERKATAKVRRERTVFMVLFLYALGWRGNSSQDQS
jgi:hypothetical protein